MKLFNAISTVLVAVALPVSAYAAIQSGGIEIGVIRGTASVVTADGTRIPLVSGQRVTPPQVIETSNNSTVELFFSNGVVGVLQPGSFLNVAIFTQDSANVPTANFANIGREPSTSNILLSLTRGSIVIDAKNLNPLSRLEVRAPNLSVVTSGAAFGVSADGATPTVSTLDGSVEVRQTNALTAPITLGAGQRATLSPNGTAAAPIVTPLGPLERSTLIQSLTNSGSAPGTEPSGEGQTGPTQTTPGRTPDSEPGSIDNTVIDPNTPPVSPNGESQSL